MRRLKQNTTKFLAKTLKKTVVFWGVGLVLVGVFLFWVYRQVVNMLSDAFGGDDIKETVLSSFENNVGNLKAFDMTWKGVNGTYGQFLTFDTRENGLRAMVKLVSNKHRQGLNTVSKLVPNLSPAKDSNDVPALVSRYQKANGGDVIHLGSQNFANMILSMSRLEKGKTLFSKEDVLTVYQKLV